MLGYVAKQYAVNVLNHACVPFGGFLKGYIHSWVKRVRAALALPSYARAHARARARTHTHTHTHTHTQPSPSLFVVRV